jgi:hypothetical protein
MKDFDLWEFERYTAIWPPPPLTPLPQLILTQSPEN